MGMPGRQFAGGSGYRYGFNGKENDWEITGWQDYGLREYDVRRGQFISVDPLTKKYPWYSPYQFAGNMPIRYIDLDGAEPANNPKSPGTKEKIAMAEVSLIETAAARNDAKKNFFSRGSWLAEDEDIKGAYACGTNGTYITDTKKESADKFNMYVNNGATLNVDESQASHFDNYEAFITHRLMSNFVSGEGAENYNFPTNGIISSKFLQSDILKGALADFNSGKTVQNKQYVFQGKELGSDVLRTGTFFSSITGLTGSGNITIIPNKDGVQIRIFNVTSLTSGAFGKELFGETNYPKSYVRDPQKTTPYGNISQTYNLFIPWSNPLVTKPK